MAEARKPRLEIVEEETPIEKPSAFNLNKFKSTQAASIANVETLQTGLPVHNMAAAGDFVRLHPDEENYWSPELCFVNVPIHGQKRETLHLIEEDLAMKYLPSGKIKRFRLALASKPRDIFFLCSIPSQNADNAWNATNLAGCQEAKTAWVEATSRKGENIDGYKIGRARDVDAFEDPKWPPQTLAELIEKTFLGRMIDCEDHPALLRLIGARQPIK